MRTRIDFVSRTTGRTNLKAMLSSPVNGFTRELSLQIRQRLTKFTEELEDFLAEELEETIDVTLTLDGYESSVFWYLVLFRPFYVDRQPALGATRWNTFELLNDPTRRHILKQLDWGVFWDEERNWLVLVWKEARKKGVLKNLRECSSWDDVVSKEERRTRKRLNWRWWKKCAESSSSAIPSWILRNMQYAKDQLWHQPDAHYDSVTVFDLSGIDIPAFEVGSQLVAKLPVAKRANFVHHYTTKADRKEYLSKIRKFERKQHKKKYYGKNKEAINQKRREQRAEKRIVMKETTGGKISLIVTQLSTALGKAYRKGRANLAMTARESEVRFNHSVDAYVNGELLGPKWHKVEVLLDQLEELTKDPEYAITRRWLLWRDQGKPGILAFHEIQRGNVAAYHQILKECTPKQQTQLVELIEHLETER